MKLTPPQPWKPALAHFLKTKECSYLEIFIKDAYESTQVFPARKDIFTALKRTSPNQTHVVIIGQDPYHGEGQAHGLAFSVPKGIPLPPSLKNIYKEIENDLGMRKDFLDGNLLSWADQGVLLLNSVLTVREDSPTSHSKQGWETCTDQIITHLSHTHEHIVFMLWGNHAKKKGSIIDRTKHLVLESSHPSPLGVYRGFSGCKHFSQANTYLEKHHNKRINW